MYLLQKTDESTNVRTLLEKNNPGAINGCQMVDDDDVSLRRRQVTEMPPGSSDGQTDLQGTLPETQAFKPY